MIGHCCDHLGGRLNCLASTCWLIVISRGQLCTIDCDLAQLCHQCFSLPCDCVPINIVMKEGKGKLKHLKNLMKENEICTMKYIDKIYHSYESLMLMHFMCII